jgi:hypothetical protein
LGTAVTICGSGKIDNYIAFGFYEIFLEFLRKKKNMNIPYNGFNLVMDMKVRGSLVVA